VVSLRLYYRQKEVTVRPPMTRADVIKGAIGPFDDYCDGYGNPGASGIGYVSVLKLSTGSFSGPKRRGASHCYRDPM
jgi:hypothetical protein